MRNFLQHSVKDTEQPRTTVVFCVLLLAVFVVALNIQFNQPPLQRFPNWDSFWTDTMTVGGLGALKVALGGGHLPAVNPYINFGWNFAGDTTVVEQYANPFNWLMFLLPITKVVEIRTASVFFIGSLGAFLWLRTVTKGVFLPLMGAMAYVSLPVLYTLTYGSILTTWIFFAPLLMFIVENDIKSSSRTSSLLLGVTSFFAVSCGNVYTLIALPSMLAAYSFFALESAFTLAGTRRRLLYALRSTAIFIGAGCSYIIPLIYNLTQRGHGVREIVSLGYHIAQRGDAMVAVRSAVEEGGSQLQFMMQFVTSLLPSLFRPIDNGLMLYLPAFCCLFAAGFFFLRRDDRKESRRIFLCLIAICLVLFSETFVFYALPNSITQNSTGRLRGQIALIPFCILLASMVAISEFGKTLVSTENALHSRWNIRLFLALMLAAITWDFWQFWLRGNLDIGPFVGSHEIISPFPSSNAVSVRSGGDMWPVLPFSNLAMFLLVALGAALDARTSRRWIYAFGAIGALAVLFQISLLNELREQQGSWAWTTRNDFRQAGYEIRHACFKRLADFSDPNYRVLAASKPVFKAVGNVPISTGRNWKLIAETELATAERVNVLWPYRNTMDPFTAAVFSSIAVPGAVQLNNLMPPTIGKAVSGLNVARAIGAKWLISADAQVNDPRLMFVGECSSPNNPGYDPQEMQGGSLSLYRIVDPIGISYRATSYRIATLGAALQDVIAGSWATRPGAAIIDDENHKVALSSLTGVQPSDGADEAASAHVDDMTFGRIVLSTSGRESGLLVLTLAYRPFWQAEVNGKPAPILRTFAGFMGVTAPGGNARVVFRYVPYDLYAGLAMSFATIGAAFLFRRTARA